MHASLEKEQTARLFAEWHCRHCRRQGVCCLQTLSPHLLLLLRLRLRLLLILILILILRLRLRLRLLLILRLLLLPCVQ